MTASNYEDSPEELSLRQTVGAELRLHREERGLEIRDVVEAVRIQARYLEALEDGRVQDLPGTVYALGFVRTYAEFLGLDGTEMVSRFKEEARGLQSQQYILPEPIDEGKVPTAAIIIIAILLAGVAYGAYHFLYGYDRDLAQEVPDVPERLAALVPPEEETPPAASTPVAPGPAEPIMPDVAPAPTDDAPQATPPSPPAPEQLARQVPAAEPVPAPVPPAPAAPAAEPPAPTAAPPVAPPVAPAATQPPEPRPADRAAAPSAPSAAATEPPPVPTPDTPAPGSEPLVAAVPPTPPIEPTAREPRVYGADNPDARVVIRAIEDAWVEVTDAEGALLFSRVLRRGDSYRVPERPGSVFVTGNAGGLEILVDGDRAPAIGPAGMVRRNVRLDPDQLKAGTAWP